MVKKNGWRLGGPARCPQGERPAPRPGAGLRLDNLAGKRSIHSPQATSRQGSSAGAGGSLI